MRRTVPALLLCSACANVEPAPEDLDGLLHWFWLHHDDATDEEIHEAVDNLWPLIDADAMSEPVRGSMSRLTDDELDPIRPIAADPALAAGFWLAGPVACDLPTLEPVLIHLAQDEIYVDVYDAYERAYTSDFAAYTARTAPTLSWDVDLTATTLGSTYHETLRGGVRYVPASEARGPILVQRTWMPEPAVFEGGNKRFDQDYQIEVYTERDAGDVVHLYGIWREMFLGAGLSTDDDFVIATILNNLESWDERTGEICAEGIPGN